MNTLQFVMVAALFAELVLTRGSQFVAWLKGAATTVETDVSNKF